MNIINKIISGLDSIFAGRGFGKFLPGIAWFFIILVLIVIPGRNMPPTGSWFEMLMVDKWVHAFLFGVLTYLLVRPLKAGRKSMVTGIMVALLSLYGLSTEFIQHYLVPGRSFDPWDWVADNAGIIIGLYINKKIAGPLK